MIKAVICFALINGGALCLQQEGERYEIQCVSPRSIGVSAPRCTETIPNAASFRSGRNPASPCSFSALSPRHERPTNGRPGKHC